MFLVFIAPVPAPSTATPGAKTGETTPSLPCRSQSRGRRVSTTPSTLPRLSPSSPAPARSPVLPIKFTSNRTSWSRCRAFQPLIPQTHGYYADTLTGCQSFHVCGFSASIFDSIKYTFLCPNGSVFNQEMLICDWWYKVRVSKDTWTGDACR